MLKRFLIASLLLPAAALAYVSPGQPTGFVNDFASMLSTEAKSGLEQELTNFEKETGNEIVIATIPTHGTDETIETYATKLFEEWKIGKEKPDNGLLLLIARDDREMRIEVGYGLEGAVPDIEAGHIISDVLTPAFQQSDYDSGVQAAAVRLMDDVRKGAPPVESSQGGSRAVDWVGFFFQKFYVFFILFIYMGALLARSKSWWAGGVLGAVFGYFLVSFLGAIIAGLLGLVFDYLVSKNYQKHKTNGTRIPWYIGGPPRGGMGGGGGFGGFGGGSSGGGGASGRW